MSLNRRQALFGSASLLAMTLGPDPGQAKCSKACDPWIASASAKAFFDLVAALPVVDIHGHVFNASDLPIMEWLNGVEIARKIDDMGLTGSGADGLAQGIIGANLYRELSSLRLAPSAQTESDLLDLLLQNRNLRALVIKDGLPIANFHGQVIRVAINTPTPANRMFLRDLTRHESITVSLRSIDRADRAAISRLGRQYARLMDTSTDRQCPIEATPALLESLKSFAEPLSRTRLENTLRWQQAYAIRVANQEQASPVALFTPAIVDMDHWMRATRNGAATHTEPLNTLRSPIADQVNVLSKISLLLPGTLAPFVGFDPWRQVLEGTAQGVVEDAILNKGFVGVKLYPALGFRPIGNAAFDDMPDEDQPFPSYADRDGLGRKLDAALLALYRFCIKHDVPIMAHCADSKGTFQTVLEGERVWVSERSHPKYWTKLLAGQFDGSVTGEFKGLRLNLAHLAFGEPQWAGAIGEALSSFENVYADASYFAEALHAPSKSGQPCSLAEGLAGRAATFLKGDTAGAHRLARKIMYGSDWFMTATEVNHESYLNTVSRLFFDKVAATVASGDQAKRVAMTADFLSGNALRFLGLDTRDSQTFKRWSGFFASSGLLNAREKAAAVTAQERLLAKAA